MKAIFCIKVCSVEIENENDLAANFFLLSSHFGDLPVIQIPANLVNDLKYIPIHRYS